MPSENQKKALALTGMAENFGKQISLELMRLLLKLLEPYSSIQVEKAVLRVLMEYEYKTLPPFAVLKKALDKISGDAPFLNPEIQAIGEWDKLIEDLSSRGSYRGNPENMNPVTAYVLRGMGGWEAACMWDISKLEFKEKQFISRWKEVYENAAYLEVPVTSSLPQGMTSTKQALNACLSSLANQGLAKQENAARALPQ